MKTSRRNTGSSTQNALKPARPRARRHVLLGNSYLTRFQMRRDNEILTLELRY